MIANKSNKPTRPTKPPKRSTRDADAALTLVEIHLQELLPALPPRQIAALFSEHVMTHLTEELANIADHGHRNENPEDIPEDVPGPDKQEKKNQFISQIARMKTEKEFGKNQPEYEDWISTVNSLIAQARTFC